jgi:hypothetical protein
MRIVAAALRLLLSVTSALSEKLVALESKHGHGRVTPRGRYRVRCG